MNSFRCVTKAKVNDHKKARLIVVLPDMVDKKMY
jgi:hypothetical protein